MPRDDDRGATERWQRVRDIFEAACDLSPGERARYVGDACGDDAGLRAEVLGLLEADSARDPRVEQVVVDAATEVGQEQHDIAGQKIGPYRLVSRIGAGGMGTVYLADRVDETFEKQVAIKVVRGDLASADAAERFRVERQILARLEHPYISRILDGGATEDGLPYLVMEYVSGEPIDRYCDARGLTVRERLILFRKVCDAVEFAHRNLIVHRDLKPHNVLVGDDGNPRLLDFGIAKIIDPELGGPALTRTGVRPMTPEYASPEQIRGEPPTVSSDVYSLGVLLYEILTGHPPFRIDGRAIRDLERDVLETDPERPSVAVTRVTTAEASHGHPTARPGKELAGDLDNITLMALDKDPARRYPSVAALSEDIRRHLEGLPVEARAATLRYRSGKFVKRHARAVAVAAVLVVLLIVATVLSTIGFVRADRARAQAETQRAIVEEINTFLTGMFAAASPVETQSGEDLTVRAVLDSAVVRVDRDLGDRPEVAAGLLARLGTTYNELGLYEEAEGCQRQAVDAYRQANALGTPDGIIALNDLGWTLMDRGEFAEAEALLRESVDLARSRHATDPQPWAASRRYLAFALAHQGKYEEAESLYEELLAELRSGPDLDGELMEVLNDASLYYRRAGRLVLAESHAREAIAEGQRRLGERHTTVATMWANLATILNELERPDEALQCLDTALEIRREVLGPDHAQVATALLNRADALRVAGRWDDAEAGYAEVLDTYRRIYGPDHPNVGYVVNNMAVGFLQAGQPERAIPYLWQANEVFRVALGDDHPHVATTRSTIALAHFRAQQLEEAEGHATVALDHRRRVLDADHTDIARTETLVAQIHLERDEYALGEPLARDAARITALNLPSAHPVRVSAEVALGRCLAGTGRYDEAETILLTVHAAADSSEGPEGPRTRDTAAALIDLYERQGDEERAGRYRQP